MYIGKYFIGKAERITLGLIFVLAFGALALSALAPSPEDMGANSDISPTHTMHRSTGAGSHKDSILRTRGYVGPPDRFKASRSGNKFTAPRVLDLNKADSATLVRVPGIGATFARRIVDLRERLGGFYTVYQLQEVYGIDADRFLALRSWFRISSPPHQYPLGQLVSGQIPKHPYLNWEQRKELERLLYRHGSTLSWRTLRRSQVFTYDDSVRLSPYFPDTPIPSTTAQDSLKGH